MSATQNFIYTFLDGTPVEPEVGQKIKKAWFESLTPAELEEYTMANKRQKEFRQRVIDNGNLICSGSSYVWKDNDALDAGKESDEVFLKYFDRYLAETGMRLTLAVSID